MSREKRDPEYPSELESHFILRLPEEPAKELKEVLKTGENFKNRLSIQIDDDMRHGEVRFDNWLMHSKIVDLPTIVESLKTIDNKSFYKSADISQMMICKTEPDQPAAEEETPAKNKKKDPYKVDKKFLWPHGVTPPTKNVRKRRFRKTLRKKCVEAPEIEKEVKRLLRADNEAVSVSWEVIQEDDDPPQKSEASTSKATPAKEKKAKADKGKQGKSGKKRGKAKAQPSTVVEIFGGALSDSEDEDNINVELAECHLSAYDSHLPENNSVPGVPEPQTRGKELPTELNTKKKKKRCSKKSLPKMSTSPRRPATPPPASVASEDDADADSASREKENMQFRIDQLRAELEELKQRRQRTQHEIAGLENEALRQRFQDVLHTLNQDIMYKEMEYQGLLVLQTSDYI